MQKNICIIGAGNIGSRHLQALSHVNTPLLIQIVDPSSESLELAKKRYQEVNKLAKHNVEYYQNLNQVNSQIDIAIIATSSNVRYQVTKQLLEKSKVKYIVFEKLLFNKKSDYEKINKLLIKNNCKAWVNCVMRVTPFYAELKKDFQNQAFYYNFIGSGFGFITGLIHYLDHIAYLSDCYDYSVDTNNLSKTLIKSKREGFMEMTGTLNVYFKNGVIGSFSCLPGDNLSLILEIFSKDHRFIRNEIENKNLYSSSKLKWKIKESTIVTPHQSNLTDKIVHSLLRSGTCKLTSYDLSSKLHITLLDALLKFLNKHSNEKYQVYPFT